MIRDMWDINKIFINRLRIFFLKKKMKFKLFFIFLFIRIILCQVERYVQDVQVDSFLPRLYI